MVTRIVRSLFDTSNYFSPEEYGRSQQKEPYEEKSGLTLTSLSEESVSSLEVVPHGEWTTSVGQEQTPKGRTVVNLLRMRTRGNYSIYYCSPLAKNRWVLLWNS